MFSKNQILNDTYQILGPLGKGGTSRIYLAYHLRLKKYVVIKLLLGLYSDDFLMRTEVDILKNLHHPYLPQVYDFIKYRDRLHTVIDFVDGNDLDAYIQSGIRLPEIYLKRYLRQIAEVLDYLHGQKQTVIHCDIKPGNIIIDKDGNAILIDFNTSIGGNQGNLLGLTLPYASPEQIQLAQYAACGQWAPFELDERTDLYSLGATFYELISGIRPTPGEPPAPLHTMGFVEYSRDFLALIDRLLEYDREKRIKSAKRLVAAIDRLDSRYRTYFTLRCVSLLVSAVLIAGGLYCYIRGVRQRNVEVYYAEYNSALMLINQGYLDSAEDVCNNILSSDKMQAFLNNQPMELARLYHAMGDVHYFREDYGTAAAYYHCAVEWCVCGAEERIIFIRDAAIAFAQNGDLENARNMLQTAQDSQAAWEDIQLISVVISARSGDLLHSMEQAQILLSTTQSREICLRAALTVAAVSDDIDTRIHWLTQAAAYDSGRTSLRGLAVAYGEKARDAANQTEREASLREAAALYEQICDSVYASSIDMLNYSVVLRMSGDLQSALEILKTAQRNDPDNYRIVMNMCFLYFEMGDDSNTSVSCNTAIQAWKADTSADRPSETSEEIQNLLEIAQRYGIGGS